MKSKKSKKILLAIDGSETSWNTARTAIQLAKILSIRILALYVVDEELILNDFADYQNELGINKGELSRTEKAEFFKNRGREVLEMLQSLCQDSGINAITEIGLGGVGETLLKQSETASILGMGRRGNGHPSVSDYLGRNFRHAAHRSGVPLLAGGDSGKPLKKILLAYNGSARAKKALKWAKKLQQVASLDILVLIVQEDDGVSVRTLEKKVESEFSKSGIKNFRMITRQGSAGERIAETAMDKGSNLIMMGGYRHQGILEWVEGSTLDTVLKKTPLPVFVT